MAHFQKNRNRSRCSTGEQIPRAASRAAAASAYPPSEKFILNCVCAVEDKPYQLIFGAPIVGTVAPRGKPQANGRTRAPSLRLTPARSRFSQPSPMSDLEGGPWFCAWCRNGSFHYCGADCGDFVCGGRMRGNLFVLPFELRGRMDWRAHARPCKRRNKKHGARCCQPFPTTAQLPKRKLFRSRGRPVCQQPMRPAI